MLIDADLRHRKVSKTGMNAESSRSHSILTMHLRSTAKNETQTSQLHLIDLVTFLSLYCARLLLSYPIPSSGAFFLSPFN